MKTETEHLTGEMTSQDAVSIRLSNEAQDKGRKELNRCRDWGVAVIFGINRDLREKNSGQ